MSEICSTIHQDESYSNHLEDVIITQSKGRKLDFYNLLVNQIRSVFFQNSAMAPFIKYLLLIGFLFWINAL